MAEPKSSWGHQKTRSMLAGEATGSPVSRPARAIVAQPEEIKHWWGTAGEGPQPGTHAPVMPPQ